MSFIDNIQHKDLGILKLIILTLFKFLGKFFIWLNTQEYNQNI